MATTTGPVTMPEKVYEQLLEKIASGDIKPGTQLVDRKIAESFGVSRTPVREALARLAKESIVDGFPKWGYYTKEFTVSDIVMIFDVREGLETVAARLAARNAIESGIYDIKKSSQEFREIKSWGSKTHSAHDKAFHNSIAVLSENTYLEKIIANYHVLSVITIASSVFNGKGALHHENYLRMRQLKTVNEHDAVVEAIANHNEEQAERLMREHIIDAKENLLKIAKENTK